MFDAMRSKEKLRRGTIYKDRKICRGEASHNLINNQEWYPNLDQNEMDIRPIHTIKSLHQIQFEDECTDILIFYSMESLLYNTYRLNNLTVFKKTILFLGNTRLQKRLEPDSNDL